MVEIEKPRIECIDSQDDVSYGKYIVEPLERGYGTTGIGRLAALSQLAHDLFIAGRLDIAAE